MLNLEPEEKVLMILHHHWISILGQMIFIIFLALLPLVILPFVAALATARLVLPLFFFISSLWYLAALLLAFAFWIDYYLDALVITDRRILNVNQEGLFKHVVSEFRLERVQDVTIEIPNFVATLFHYGNITIQTAGEINFSIKEVTRPHVARDLILNIKTHQK